MSRSKRIKACIELTDHRKSDELFTCSAIRAEHVGRALLPIYFKCAWELLRPGGVFLNHGIGIHANARILGADFVHRYVFPDGECVPIDTTLRAAEEAGFEVRDVENLKEHYVYTLRHWIRRYGERSDEVKRIAGELNYRIWRVYLAAGLHEFEVATTHLYQTLLVKADKGRSGLPLTREDWYSH